MTREIIEGNGAIEKLRQWATFQNTSGGVELHGFEALLTKSIDATARL
jgi:hypothetical protein